MGRACSQNEDRSALKILTDKPTEKRPVGKRRRNGRTILEYILKK